MRPVPARLSVAATLLAAFAVAACGGPSPTSPPAASQGIPPTQPASTATPAETAGPGPSVSAADLPVNDPALLALLPATIDDVAVTEEPELFAEAIGDPDFVASVEAAAFPFVTQSGDLASGVVARLRPGVFSDAFFRDWRDSYNTGACAQAGGVVGNAEAELGGRTVYIASCAGGLLVYHVWLTSRRPRVHVLARRAPLRRAADERAATVTGSVRRDVDCPE